MRWNEVMPVNECELAEGPDPFPVKDILNREFSHSHILSVCLFRPCYVDYKYIIQKYISDFKSKVNLLKSWRGDLTIRIYLDSKLSSIRDIFDSCEIYLMEGDSNIGANGMIWRHLAFEEATCPVTVVDIEDIDCAKSKIFFTESLGRTNSKFWRVPIAVDYNSSDEVFYKTIAGCYFGGVEAIPIRAMYRAFMQNYANGSLPRIALDPRTLQPKKIFGSTSSEYGFDEYFLNTTIYPYLVSQGCIAVVGSPRHSLFFSLDIEFSTLMNAENSLDFVHFRQLVGRDITLSHPNLSCNPQ